MSENPAVLGPSHWQWTLMSGLFTAVLAVVAFFLPDIGWLPQGGMVGWLLLLAGTAELGFSFWRRHQVIGKVTFGSGLLTAIAGLLFVFRPLAGFFPVTNLVLAWLFVRGAWILVTAVRLPASRQRTWLALSGITDVLLGAVLLAGLPVAMLVVTIFGPTREMVARFALILAASFAVTAWSQIAIAFDQRRKSAGGNG